MTSDEFQTSRLRHRVLRAWQDSAARFREDANAEEDFALVAYQRRVVVELAQNAADAAALAGGDGRLLLRLRGREFTVANTGAPLTAAGVESLSTLRASAKRGEPDRGQVGRFGVGFAAVVAVSDHVRMASGSGAVEWDRRRADTALRDALGGHEALAAELARRDGHLPMLRLPFGVDAAPLAGFDTTVALRLRDEAAQAAVTAELDAIGPALLLALPALREVVVETDAGHWSLRTEPPPAHPAPDEQTGDLVERRTTTLRTPAGEERTGWLLLRREGELPPELLADLPTEQRAVARWRLLWAIPVGEADAPRPLPATVPRVLHAPTPSAVPVDLPALLVATFPLSADRRHLAPGAAAGALVRQAAQAYARLLCALPAEGAVALVPPPGLGRGETDAELREAIRRRLADTPFLRGASGEALRPRDALLVGAGEEVAQAVADLLPTVLPGSLAGGLTGLGVGQLTLAELTDELAGVQRDPAWWGRLYRALRREMPPETDLADLAGLPVPLVDGRTVRGARGVLRLTAGLGFPAERLGALGLRILHPDADDPLLQRLGASAADAAEILAHERTRAAVTDSLDSEDPDAVAEAVLVLVAACEATVADLDWLGELALTDTQGEYCPASELMLPDSPLRDVLADDAPIGVVDGDLVARHGAAALRAVGVLHGFAVLHRDDLTVLAGDVADSELAELPLDGIADWGERACEGLDDAGLPVEISEFRAVRDLEFVRADRWRRALELLGEPEVWRAVAEPVRVTSAAGESREVAGHAAWWLARHARFDGAAPRELCVDDAEPEIRSLFDPAPGWMSAGLARTLGVRDTVAGLLAEPSGARQLLRRLADDERHVTTEQLGALLSALSEVPPEAVEPPERVRALRPGSAEPVVADAEDTVVLDAPDLLPLVAEDDAYLAVPPHRAEALADVLDLPLATDVYPGEVASPGELREVPPAVRPLIGAAVTHYRHHDPLTVDGVDVPWRCVDGEVHAADAVGLARGLAWASGRWHRRALIAEALHDPDRIPTLRAEAGFDA